MRQQQSPKKYSKLRYYLLILILCALGFTILYFLDQYFMIRKIEIVSGSVKTSIRQLETLRQKNILLISEAEITNIISKNNPQLRVVVVEKKYPDQLIITIEPDISVAALRVNQGYLLLSQTGKILGKNRMNTNDLPQINFYQQLNYFAYVPGDQIDLQDLIIALHFNKRTRELGFSVLSIDIAGVDMIRLNLNDRRVLLFSTEKDLNLQDYQFERLIRQFKIEGQGFVSLDFRFDKPIIKLK